MPLTLTKETVRGYDVCAVEINERAGEEMLHKRLKERLDQVVQSNDGEVLHMQFSTVRQNGLLTVTLSAECLEQIGETVPFEGTVGHTKGPGSET